MTSIRIDKSNDCGGLPQYDCTIVPTAIHASGANPTRTGNLDSTSPPGPRGQHVAVYLRYNCFYPFFPSHCIFRCKQVNHSHHPLGIFRLNNYHNNIPAQAGRASEDHIRHGSTTTCLLIARLACLVSLFYLDGIRNFQWLNHQQGNGHPSMVPLKHLALGKRTLGHRVIDQGP
jgi:hypothetical protein